MTLKKFETEIRKTGFVLENDIAQVLKRSGWTVISNKYYVDDTEETVREIDLIAYRVTKVQHFDVYTTLIISCKKSESNSWALLARELNAKDPNADWWPLHVWSNDKALQYQFSQPGNAKTYHETAISNGVQDALSLPPVEVFAFQEMDKASGKPQNDKPIFSAVTSLMKAQAYELAALPARKKTPAVYTFNLLSVVDTDLLRLMFSDGKIECATVDTEHYLARYIIRKREVFSRVRFIKAQAFAETIRDYNRLHESNCKWFAGQCDSFYMGILTDYQRSSTLVEDLKKQIQWYVNYRLEQIHPKGVKFDDFTLYWNKEEQSLEIGIDLPDEAIKAMTADKDIVSKVATSLNKLFRYEGSFKFTADFPF